MSIIVAVKKNGQTVLASDTAQSSDGMLLDSRYVVNHEKTLEHKGCHLGLAGWAACEDVVASILKRYARKIDLSNRASILEGARFMHDVMKNEYFLNPTEDKDQPVESSQISMLIASSAGIFELESYRSVAEYRHFWAIGSGKALALGAMQTTFNMDYSAEEIAEFGVKAACAFDDGCAEPISMRVVV